LVAQPLRERIILDLVHPMLELDDKVRILQALECIGRGALRDGLPSANGLAQSSAGNSRLKTGRKFESLKT